MKKRSKVYLKLFLSYLGVLIIPIFIASFIYNYTVNRIRIQAEHMNRNLLETIKTDLDKELESIQKMTSHLRMDTSIQQLSRVKGEFTASDQLNLYYLFNDLSSVAMSEDFVNDVFVYFNNTQKICSIKGNMDAEFYYNLYCINDSYAWDDFREYMGEFHHNDILYLNKTAGDNMALFSITVLDSFIVEPAATICVTINFDQIEERLLSSKWSDGMEVLVLNRNGDKICQEGSLLADYDFNYAELAEGSYYKGDILNEDCTVTVLNSDKSDWKYIVIMPISLIDQEARNIQRVAMTGLFLCILSSFAFSYILTKRNYNPLKMVLDTFKKHGNYDISDNDNEYQWLNRKIEYFFQEHVDTQRVLSSNQKHLKQYYLTRLLQEFYDGKPIGQYGIRLNLEYNVVVLISSPSDRMPSDPEHYESALRENALQRFVILNIFEEMCSNYFNLEILEMGEKVAAIINLPEPDPKYLAIIKEQIENLQQITEDSFAFSCNALIGPICQGMAGIHTSYRQASELEEYIYLLDENLIQYEDVKNIQPQYDYPVELEKKIIQAIQAGDSRQAGQSMREVFTRNTSGKVSPDIYRCLIYDMIGTLLKGAAQAGYQDAAKDLELPDARSIRLPAAEVAQTFQNHLDHICDEIKLRQKETSQDRSFSQKIEEYIQAQFRDPDLNISITSQHFDITPSYLSSVYKKQTGRSLLDYITTLRLEYAESLLEDGLSVVEVAEKAGFRDSGSFIRTFKKKRGVTPGQIKKKF